MDFEWVAIALGDVAWISLAFALGFVASQIGLPPLVGFLATGFALNYFGFSGSDMLQKLADLGITLLLFTVGLKLNVKVLMKPHVWAVTALHMGMVIAVIGTLLFSLALLKAPLFSGLDFQLAILLAFALSFSSTVFVVKSLEENGEMKSQHGRVAIGILVMQDIAAVVFLAASMGKLPSIWALLLILLIPMRPLFHGLLQKTGHGELLILFGLVVALGGAEVFELVGVKDDLGALILGLLISSHPKSAELAKSMLAFKDLFLVGFFLSIGMSGELSLEATVIGLLLVPLIFLKSALFFRLLAAFKLRTRTAALTSLSLNNYSEFGLIVMAIGVSAGWLNAEWLVVMAIALSFSFVVSAPLTRVDHRIYTHFRSYLQGFQRPDRLPGDEYIGDLNASIAVFGMGRIGVGAYDKLQEHHGNTVVGIDFDLDKVKNQRKLGRNIVRGDPSDADFWDKLDKSHGIKRILLALPNVESNLAALEQLREIKFAGEISATAHYLEEEETLRNAGATEVFNLYSQLGASYADYIEENKTLATEH